MTGLKRGVGESAQDFSGMAVFSNRRAPTTFATYPTFSFCVREKLDMKNENDAASMNIEEICLPFLFSNSLIPEGPIRTLIFVFAYSRSD